jgi:hypothetical protein
MSLKARLLIGYGVFIAALVVLRAWSAWRLHDMGKVSRRPVASKPTILDDEESPALDHSQRRFIVTTPAGQKHEVLVEIDVEAILYVERMTGRRLKPESSFWTSQARRFLSNFLWNERKVPPMRRLVLRSVDPDRLPIAVRWKAEGVRGN